MKHYLPLLLTLFLLQESLSAQPVIPGLASYWKLDGNFTDASGNGINGTNFGATVTANNLGVANAAMFFNNPTATVSAYATHPSNALLNYSGTQNFSISALINIASPYVHAGGIYDNNLNYNGIGFWYWLQGTTIELRVNYRNGSLGMPNLPIGSWVHVTAVRENGTLKLYLNGVLKATGPEGTGTPSYSYPARIGTMFYTQQTPAQYNGHNGRIDELRVFNRALTTAEILQLNSSLLPLKMGQFNALRKANTVELTWETLSESNTASFTVERSKDGKEFTAIGTVKAAGNSTAKKSISFRIGNRVSRYCITASG